MTKEQLIQSFIDSNISLPETGGPLLPKLAAVVTVIAVMLIFFALSKQGRGVVLSFIVSVTVGVGGPLIIFLAIMTVQNMTGNTPSNTNKVYHEWKTENFEEFLEVEPKELYLIKDYSVESDESIKVELETNAPALNIKSIRSIKYMDTGTPYLKAVRVEGLAEVGIEDGFYDAEIYLVKQHTTQ